MNARDKSILEAKKQGVGKENEENNDQAEFSWVVGDLLSLTTDRLETLKFFNKKGTSSASGTS